jgi:hypothetical protein
MLDADRANYRNDVFQPVGLLHGKVFFFIGMLKYS